MIAVLSPAKTLDFSPTDSTATQPRMLADSEELVKTLSRKSAADLQELMSVSEKLATLNRDRYRDFSTPFTTENAKPALLAFQGDVYQGLGANDFDEDDIDHAQQRLRILSGLYGLLRPRDLMQAYRLEMGTRLPTPAGKNLYEFWGDRISQLLRADLEANQSEHLVNLASVEYFKSLRPEELGVPVVNVHFKEWRGDRLKVIAFNAKKARGKMARQIVKHRLDSAHQLREQVVDGYVFNAGVSDEENYYFIK